ncbi:patatin-like phospholipase family protein [Methylobacterium gnaphalii]|uniref:Cyclic nucleotide-binding protein n=1 Tax=Methylobacterium gnaphalii TaxID=1010610 RepID=A0A512JRU0_9HYPH|nr:patatin-like phospholipase family protein [Methylobacterium gnaphalii]GEP12622.1 cyclic nucleotide-binding protein [Methylobacterium gnaphalii]GJD71710.1 putative NTE family protein [Methylobacterium gnaphalii]GLS48879.1 cyclic nucleotide-binding protein [Methylobacterium gnaphalii]
MSAADIPFLVGLDPDAMHEIRERFVSVAVAGGWPVFEQGEEGDALYTLVSGAVGISSRQTDTGETRHLARLAPPKVFGEMALLSAEPRSATAIALRDSHLLRLSRTAFEEVIEKHPRTLLYFSRLLAERLRTASERRPLEQVPRTFAVLAVTDGPDPDLFGHMLAKTFDEILPGKTGCLTDWPEGADESWFHDYEARHSRTIFVAHRVADCPWCQLCLRHADHILLLAEPGIPRRPGALECIERHQSDWIRIDLAIRQDPKSPLPLPLHPDVAALPAAMRIQVRDGNGRDRSRLARLASGSARGLVLGGGGARGLAHVGVLRALEDAGLPVDFVGGTSMGAIVAASVAMDLCSDEIRDRMTGFFVGQNPLNDYTLPFHALTRGMKADAGLRRTFGAARIEDLWLPFVCVSSNLTTGEAMVHRSGDLAAALRASIAIPGLLPPIVSADGILVDGGMMNNLPADVLADLQRGPVLAVDVGSDRAFQDMPRRSWRGKFMRRLLGSPDEMPAIAPLLLRAATVSSDAQTMMSVNRATVVLKPPLAGVDLRAWSSLGTTSELGYRHAQEAIETGRLRGWA